MHVVQLNYFDFLLQGITARGESLFRLEKETGLRYFDLRNTDNYVPAGCLYKLFHLMRHKYGIDDLLEEFDEEISMKNTHNIGTLFLTQPDLLSAIKMSLLYGPLNFTAVSEEFRIEGKRATHSFLQYEVPGHLQNFFNQLYLGQILDTLSYYGANNDALLEIHLPGKQIPDLGPRMQDGFMPNIKLNQSHIRFVYRTSALNNKGFQNNPERAALEIEDLATMTGRIERLLDASSEALKPTMTQMAEYLGIHKRKFQRKLQAENTSFAHILEQWRFKRATALLANDRYSIMEISEILGYNEVQNFHRAFKRWTGCTPVVYRNQID